MYPCNLEVQQGTKILWEGSIREIAFKIAYVLGIDDSWSDAEERGKAITEQMIQDWLDEMSASGRIQSIDPITFIQTIENGMPESMYNRAPELTELIWKKSIQTEDQVVLAQEAPPKQQVSPEDCLVHKAVSLRFDGTASQERAIRILRAYEEPYTFIHQPNGNWSCLHKDRVYTLFVDIHKHLGYCTCQDFQQRGIRTGMPCKHIYGYVLQDGRIKGNI